MKLKDALKKDKFIVTSEVQSPIDEEPEQLIDNLNLNIAVNVRVTTWITGNRWTIVCQVSIDLV